MVEQPESAQRDGQMMAADFITLYTRVCVTTGHQKDT